jgi:tetratricopeptide (TPR) repeat protein
VRLLQHEATLDTSKEKLIVATYRLRRAINLGAHNAEAFRLWGALDYHNGDYAQALDHLGTAVRLAPSDAEAHRRRALAFVRTANLDAALNAARSAAQLDPHNSLARETYGLLLMLKGENESALKEFDADQRNRAAGSATEAHLTALVATNNHEAALDILIERAKHSPDDYVLLYDLGRMYQLAGKPKTLWEESLGRAHQAILQELKKDTMTARAYAYLGLVQTRLGDFAEGAASGKRALALAPHNVSIRYLVARMYALQREKLDEGFEQLALAVQQRLMLDCLLDLDVQNLRNDPNFLAKIAR